MPSSSWRTQRERDLDFEVTNCCSFFTSIVVLVYVIQKAFQICHGYFISKFLCIPSFLPLFCLRSSKESEIIHPAFSFLFLLYCLCILQIHSFPLPLYLVSVGAGSTGSQSIFSKALSLVVKQRATTAVYGYIFRHGWLPLAVSETAFLTQTDTRHLDF